MYTYNSWDPPDTGMVPHMCVCVINNSWDPLDTGMGLYVYIPLMALSGHRNGALSQVH